MPIDIDEFNKNNKMENVAKKIVDFLRDNSERAFTYEELSKEIDLNIYDKPSFNWAFWCEIIKKLENDKKIESKNINGETYYHIKN